MLSILPTLDRVFVSRKAADSITKGGIFMPGLASEQQDVGVIVATGPGKTYSNGDTYPLVVKVGDQVMFSKLAGQTTIIDDQELVVMREDDILAIIG